MWLVATGYLGDRPSPCTPPPLPTIKSILKYTLKFLKAVTTVEPLLMTTPDSRPPCLWQTLALVPTASPFRIVLKKP